MKPQIFNARTLISTAVASILLVACTARQIQPEAVNNARSKLTMLQSNQPLASQAPVAIKEAEVAVRAAEVSQGDKEQVAHLMYIAERKVDTAQALAESRLLVEQRTALSQQRETARLDSRTKEVDIARSNADSARIETLAAQKEVENARSNAESSRLKTLAAQQESANAQQKAADLQRQIAELNAKPTERGLVVTLGDVLFDTGKAELKSGATTNLAKLATFLNQHQNRSVMIEGHTDTVDNADYNQALSQRRADSVKGWLMKQGIHSDRLVTAGKGETSPVSGNDSASGRQLNRRVEVIIENTDANVDEKT
ncbi:OmpA family protein [Methylophilus sp. DW102]|uniref:OmpA family protein n=1 Tax=Methylophilus sp. DW102 TaxID=3095607 RepID=UPI0030902A0C|nr:OmpA family protein [Methylophilus sp. DW102]